MDNGLLNDIKRFPKHRLRSVQTKVLTPDGRLLVESNGGARVVRQTGIGAECGFIPDNAPDLKVGMCMPHLFIGSQDGAADATVLQQNAISHLLNVGMGIPNYHEADGYIYKVVQIPDLPSTRLARYFDECFQYMDQVLQGGGNLLVHCNAGTSRAPSVVIAYLMARLNLGLNDAYKRVKDCRPSTKPNDGFMQQLRQLEGELRQQRMAKRGMMQQRPY